jgi:hypothetical protein
VARSQANRPAILIDELESDEKRHRILEMFRIGGMGGDVHRGTTDQRGEPCTIQHIPWMAAIESGLKRAADKNRFVRPEFPWNGGALRFDLGPQRGGSRGRPRGQRAWSIARHRPLRIIVAHLVTEARNDKPQRAQGHWNRSGANSFK